MLPCTHCGEQIAEDTTVCPQCGAFEPFSGIQADSPTERGQASTDSGGKGSFKGLLRDVGCQIAPGCGGMLAVGVVVALVAVIAAFCGGSESGYGYDLETQEINCQEYLDAVAEASVDLLWGDDEVEVFSITANLKRDRLDWNKQVCPGIAETSGGKYEIWYFVTGKDQSEWSLDYDMRPLQSSGTPNP